MTCTELDLHLKSSEKKKKKHFYSVSLQLQAICVWGWGGWGVDSYADIYKMTDYETCLLHRLRFAVREVPAIHLSAQNTHKTKDRK